jgi:hypothetical protein
MWYTIIIFKIEKGSFSVSAVRGFTGSTTAAEENHYPENKPEIIPPSVIMNLINGYLVGE